MGTWLRHYTFICIHNFILYKKHFRMQCKDKFMQAKLHIHISIMYMAICMSKWDKLCLNSSKPFKKPSWEIKQVGLRLSLAFLFISQAITLPRKLSLASLVCLQPNRKGRKKRILAPRGKKLQDVESSKKNPIYQNNKNHISYFLLK